MYAVLRRAKNNSILFTKTSATLSNLPCVQINRRGVFRVYTAYQVVQMTLEIYISCDSETVNHANLTCYISVAVYKMHATTLRQQNIDDSSYPESSIVYWKRIYRIFVWAHDHQYHTYHKHVHLYLTLSHTIREACSTWNQLQAIVQLVYTSVCR